MNRERFWVLRLVFSNLSVNGIGLTDENQFSVWMIVQEVKRGGNSDGRAAIPAHAVNSDSDDHARGVEAKALFIDGLLCCFTVFRTWTFYRVTIGRGLFFDAGS